MNKIIGIRRLNREIRETTNSLKFLNGHIGIQRKKLKNELRMMILLLISTEKKISYDKLKEKFHLG